MENDDDFAISLAKTGPDGKVLTQLYMCSKCNRALPPAKFKRALTVAEAKSKGYSGNRQVIIETQHCADCRPRRRRKPESFTTAELKAKAARGEISEVVATAIAKTRTEKALREQRAAGHKRWEGLVMNAWKGIIAELQLEIRSVTQQRKYARANASAANMGPVLTYTDSYLAMLRQLRADLTLTMRSAKLKAEHDRWQDFLRPEEKERIAAWWTAIEPNLAARMRRPGAFAKPLQTAPVSAQDIPIVPTTSQPTPTEPIDWDNI